MATPANNTPSGVPATGLPARRRAVARQRRTALPDPIALALAENRLYGQIVAGDCMAPLVRDGDTIVCDPKADYVAGDLVVIYFREGDGSRALVKRLSMGVMGRAWPLKLHPDSNCLPLVVFESLSPPTGYQLPGDRILGIHRVVAKATSDGKLIEDGFAETVARHWQDALQRRRASVIPEMLSEARSA